MVAHFRRARGSDLELPLTGHDLGVDAADLQAGHDASLEVLLDELTTHDVAGAGAAVVRALGTGVAALGEAVGPPVLHERVLLLHAVPGLLGLVLGLGGGAGSARVGRVHGAIGRVDVAEHEDVAVGAERIRAREDGTQDAVGAVARRLVGAGAVEAPLRRGVTLVHDLGLGAQKGGRLGAVDPNVFSPDLTHRNSPI